MKRMHVAMFGFFAAACGDLHGVEDTRLPLVKVRGTIPVALTSTNVVAGIMWSGVPLYIDYCQERGPNPREPARFVSNVGAIACRNPFEVVPQLVGPTVRVEPGAKEFELELDQLPTADVMVGPPSGRVAYGSLVLFYDGDDDLGLDFQQNCGGRDNDDGPPRIREPIFGSSFSILTEPQQRITYLEGEFDSSSYFYPPPEGCAPPPKGFSKWNVGPLLQDGATCTTAPIDTPIEIRPNYPELPLKHQSCRPRTRDSFPRPPPLREPPKEWIRDCTKEGVLALSNPKCACPHLQLYSLRGCYDRIDCDNPDWDVRAIPPAWWPCAVPQAGN